MEVHFERAQEDTIADILAMMRALYALDGYPFDGPRARAALHGLLADTRLGGIWLIRADGGLAGYVALTLGYSLEFHGRDAFVDELYLVPEYRHRGIGRQALVFVEQQCRTLGVRALHLQVEHDNTAAQRLNRGLGFHAHDRIFLSKPIEE